MGEDDHALLERWQASVSCAMWKLSVQPRIHRCYLRQ
jgi:hypothetical protein